MGNVSTNKFSDRGIEETLPALSGNYKSPTNKPTDQPSDGCSDGVIGKFTNQNLIFSRFFIK